jgi:hypothetical protein
MEYFVCLLAAVAIVNFWFWRLTERKTYRLALENQRLQKAVDGCLKELDQYKHPENHMFLAS